MSKDIDKIEEWILKYHPEFSKVDHELDLIDNRLIDSLRFMELIFLLEQVSGKSIDTNKINIDDFRNLQRITEKFLTSSIIEKGLSHAVS